MAVETRRRLQITKAMSEAIAQQRQRPAEEPPYRGGRIMVVDDDPSIRTMLRLIFERAGYEVAEAASGMAALNLICDRQPPDVVLTDLTMPVMNGNELIRRLRSEPRTASIPIVVVSGDAEAAKGFEAAERADALMSKPFVPADLVKLVQLTLTRWSHAGSTSIAAAPA